MLTLIPYTLRPAVDAMLRRRHRPLTPLYPDTYDLRAQSTVTRKRPISWIDRVIVHQTGVEFGVSRRQIRRWGGVERAHRMRFAATPYHVVITRGGDLLLIHPWDRWTYHAGPVNRHTIGVAFEGRWPETERGRRGWHTRIQPRVLAAMQGHICRIVKMIRDDVGDVLWSTHRQCSRRRPADPGEWIMQHVIHTSVPHDKIDLDWTTNGGRPALTEWRKP